MLKHGNTSWSCVHGGFHCTIDIKVVQFQALRVIGTSFLSIIYLTT